MQVRMRASDVLLTLVMNVPTTHKIVVSYCDEGVMLVQYSIVSSINFLASDILFFNASG